MEFDLLSSALNHSIKEDTVIYGKILYRYRTSVENMYLFGYKLCCYWVDVLPKS